MTSLSVDTEISDSLELGDYTVTDLQSGVVIGDTAVTDGTLEFISDYPAFDEGEDSGNYLAIHADIANAPIGLTYTITVTSGDNQVVDFDTVHVIHVTDKDSQTISVVASATGYTSVTKTYALTGLTCLES